MEILLITGSPRKGCNTERMAEAFAEGARESGNTAITVRLSELKVAPCLACAYCFSHGGKCVQNDGMAQVYAAMDKAEMVVFASPIYYNGLSAKSQRSLTGYMPAIGRETIAQRAARCC